MDRLGKLNSASSIGLDTAIFIYHLERNKEYLAFTKMLFDGVEAGKWQAVTSVVALLEIIVKPLKLGRIRVARKYETLIMNFPNLMVVDIDRNIARQAAQLRAKYGIKTPDAIQVAACITTGAELFICNDIRLKKIQDEIPTTIVGDFIS
jgi:predicted nucleic acid-binding protein